MLPADDEEQDRQDVEHRVLTLVLDSLYAAPELILRAMAPKQDRTPAILDVGTGSGMWAMDMAREFPHAEVVGIDLTPPTLHNTHLPPNCRFEVDDVNLDLSHYAQTLRADGVLLLVAGAYQLYDEQRVPLPVVSEGEPGWTACQTLLSAAFEVGKKLGGDLNAPNEWPGWLQSSKLYTNIGVEDIYVPIGPWMKNLDYRCTRISELLQIDASQLFPAFRPLLIAGGADPATMDRYIVIAEKEMKEMQPRAFAKWRYVWATRTRTKWFEYES
ncbi:hypothetical protein FRB99_004517 [Tulasnella sp. 403]|nr:hypothetical protein FRB99_004517 [Tulasnella sp. 403]